MHLHAPYVPGFDPAHRGGDVWTADPAMAMMEHERWSGMLLTLGSLDKEGHMWGGINDDGTYPAGSAEEQAHLRFIAKTDGINGGGPWRFQLVPQGAGGKAQSAASCTSSREPRGGPIGGSRSRSRRSPR